MKVFVIIERDEYTFEDNIVAVFSTREKAENFKSKNPEVWINEYEVDEEKEF